MKASPWKKTADRQKERELKRDAVLRAAAQAFNENGFHKTSLDDVAERLNVTKPTIYYYVKNKDQILFECVRIGLERLEDASAEISGTSETGLSRLVSLWRVYAQIVTEDFGRCLILVGEDPLPQDTRRELRALKGRIDKRFRSVIAEGIADGSIRTCDPKMAAFAAAGALSWIARWYDPRGPLKPEELADQIIDLLIHGVGGDIPARTTVPGETIAALPPRRAER
ncbi:TetR/AcrR family transcriptional regulator [Microvirga pudoricolor]|uniref:TetR/AcrR family transcriptional regulator n=1 Tax=Microvirga pudoricolor TaxID=2778729 RepID=UPI001951E9E8|nr:TetR/AcrR family transcriptional regulator [Microvirga pudoricolor]MBM6592607.1 TetR family transcriptional regulator [Microvirga pudoricolor]